MSSNVSAPPDTSEFPKVLRRYWKNQHNTSGTIETILCEEREYAPGTPRGQYQLWEEGKYIKNITSEVEERRKQHLPMAWVDDRPYGLDVNIHPNKTRNIASMLGRLQREAAFDHTEAPSFRDYWYQREDPRIQKLQAEIAAKDAQITQLQSTISSLNILLRQEKDYRKQERIRFQQAENAGQKERIRVDRKRGNLVKCTKYQWILDNTITETLSEEAAKYEQGMKYIQDTADAFLEMPIKEIDNRTVEEFEYHTNLGLFRLMQQFRLNYSTTRVWRNGIESPAYVLIGPISILLEHADAEELCKLWTIYLTIGIKTTFTLIERVKKVLTAEELENMDKIVENIHSFMRLFNVGMPKT
jgi:hypothetical protein